MWFFRIKVLAGLGAHLKVRGSAWYFSWLKTKLIVMDNDDTRRRINDVFSKWDRGPPTEALEGARGGPTTTRSQHWDNAFDASEVSASRVERRMAQAKPRKRRVSFLIPVLELLTSE